LHLLLESAVYRKETKKFSFQKKVLPLQAKKFDDSICNDNNLVVAQRKFCCEQSAYVVVEVHCFFGLKLNVHMGIKFFYAPNEKMI
jgi:hypothetical protein